MWSGRLFTAVAVLIASGLAHAPAAAQFQRGSIYGTISDPNQGVLPGATVTIESEALLQPQTFVTNEVGSYRFPALPPGTYKLTMNLSGFRAFVRDGVQVTGGSNVRVDAVLELVQIAEVVTVTGDAPSVDLKSNTITVTYDAEKLQAIPTARDVWSIMESMPGVVASNINVGGSAAGTPNQVYAYGSQAAENTYDLNGVNLNDPSTQGSSFARYDEDSFAEVRVETGAKPPEVRGAGVYINMLTKSGGNTFSGGTAFFGQDESFNSDNITPALRQQGVTSSNAVLKNYDWSGRLGGPVIKSRVWFFGAGRYQALDKAVLNFVLPDGTLGKGINKIFSYTAKGTWQATKNNKFEFYYNRSGRQEPYRNAGPLWAPDAVWNEDSFANVYQGTLTSVLSNKAFVDVRGGAMIIDFPLLASEFVGPNPVNIQELSTTRRSGAPEELRHHYRTRYRFDTALSLFVDDAMGSHELRGGVQFEDGGQEVFQEVYEDVHLQFDRGRPSRVRIWNSPTHYNDRYRDYAFHVNDTWNPVRQLTITAGMRLSFAEAYYPDQTNRGESRSPYINLSRPGAYFPEEVRLQARRDVLSWAHPAPRIGLTWDPVGDGKTAIRASYGRYYAQLDSDFADVVNPNLPRAVTLAWNDLNGDLRPQAGELDRTALLDFGSAAGTGVVGDTIDPDTDQPLEDQITVGIDREVGNSMSVGASYQYRRGDRGIGFENSLVPFSVYEPRTITNPLAGGGQLQIFNLPLVRRGQVQRVMTNQETATREYNGVEFRFNRRFSGRWQFQSALTIGTGKGIATDHFQGFWQDPNLLINRYGADPRDSKYIGRLTGSYLLPWTINLGGNYRYTSGRPFTPTLRLTGLNQGDVTINTQEPGVTRLDSQHLLDLRIEKRVRLNGKYDVAATFDVFNVMNASTIIQANPLAGTLNVNTGVFTPGAAFRQVQGIFPPRVMRLGVRFNF